MKKISLSIFVIIVLIFSDAQAQLIFSVQYKSEAKVKVFVAQYKSEADLLVFKCDYRSEANGNKGFWFFTKYKSEAKFPIYFCDYKSESDIVIYFVKYKSEAGWKNSSKKHLFYYSQLYSQATIKNLDATAFKKQIDEKKSILIDLRTTKEIEAKGKIKGAKQIDFFDKDTEAIILKLDKNKSYLIYCAGGGRSGECAELMLNNGFKSIANLEKGFDDWKRKGFEIEIRE